jgi:hypothetical protein
MITAERVKLLEMARSWKRLADDTSRIEELVEEAKERGLIPPRSEMQ